MKNQAWNMVLTDPTADAFPLSAAFLTWNNVYRFCHRLYAEQTWTTQEFASTDVLCCCTVDQGNSTYSQWNSNRTFIGLADHFEIINDLWGGHPPYLFTGGEKHYPPYLHSFDYAPHPAPASVTHDRRNNRLMSIDRVNNTTVYIWDLSLYPTVTTAALTLPTEQAWLHIAAFGIPAAPFNANWSGDFALLARSDEYVHTIYHFDQNGAQVGDPIQTPEILNGVNVQGFEQRHGMYILRVGPESGDVINELFFLDAQGKLITGFTAVCNITASYSKAFCFFPHGYLAWMEGDTFTLYRYAVPEENLARYMAAHSLTDVTAITGPDAGIACLQSWICTQDAYDALPIKLPSALYFINDPAGKIYLGEVLLTTGSDSAGPAPGTLVYKGEWSTVSYTEQILSFDDGVVPPVGWSFDATPSIVDLADETVGTTKALQFADIDDNEQTYGDYAFTWTAGSARQLRIRYQCLSEEGYDLFGVLLDDVQIAEDSGVTGIKQVLVDVSNGAHTLRLRYAKDSSVSTSSDTANICSVTFYDLVAASYAENDVVLYEGKFYMATTDGSEAVPGADGDWICLGAAGAVTLVTQAEYDALETKNPDIIYVIQADGGGVLSGELMAFSDTSGKAFKGTGKTLADLEINLNDLQTLSDLLASIVEGGSLPPDGLSAYELWLAEGNEGTIDDFFADIGNQGDVTGPETSTDSTIVLFDGITGKLIKDSGITLVNKADAAVTLNAQTDSYTLILADAGKLVQMGKETAQTVTVPTNTGVAFPVGTQILIEQSGAGQVTIVGDTDVTVSSADSANKTVAQHSVAGLIKIATDAWLLFGDLEA